MSEIGAQLVARDAGSFRNCRHQPFGHLLAAGLPTGNRYARDAAQLCQLPLSERRLSVFAEDAERMGFVFAHATDVTYSVTAVNIRRDRVGRHAAGGMRICYRRGYTDSQTR